jgi:hypothetical protein
MLLINQFNGDAGRFGLVGDVLAQLGETPVAHFMLTFGVKLFPIGRRASIRQRQRACLPLNGVARLTLCSMSVARRLRWARKRFLRR